MIAIQKPPSMFSSPVFRPAHTRHPSAPVVVRPTHTPGVLTISKPFHSAPRPQLAQAQPRAPRSSPKSKPQQRALQPTHVQIASVDKPKAPASTPLKAESPSPMTNDKPLRGRKQHKQSKDVAGRDNSVSPSNTVPRRHAHQPSPPPRIPSPPKATIAPRAQVSRGKPEEKTSPSDPFTDHADVSPQGKTDGKAFRSPPRLITQPSGKLARRRQANALITDSPTPKVHSRRKGRAHDEGFVSLLSPASTVPQPRQTSTDMTLHWDSFPICDDSSEFGDDSDATPPTTPIREVSTAPSKAKSNWLHESRIVDAAPHTAPMAATSGFPFTGISPCSTPTPPQRRRNHRRVPSEGVFTMSTDEESDPFESIRARIRTPVSIPRQRCFTDPPSSYGTSPARAISSSAPSATGYFAGSVFQNSPSPDDLPAPSF